MPRPRKNPYEEGTQEWQDRQAELEAASTDGNGHVESTERNITVTVSKDAITIAKSLAVLGGMSYRQVLGQAAQEGVERLVGQVRAKLQGDSDNAMPF